MNTTHIDHPVDFAQDPANLTYTFGGASPVAEVTTPAVLTTSTLDAYAGRLTDPSVKPTDVDFGGYLNPQTGPFLVNGARPGDTLAVHFRSITPHFDFGISAILPFFGALTSTPQTPTLQAPLDDRAWRYAIDHGADTVRMDALDSDHSFVFDLDPMRGTAGVAPAGGEVHSSLTPGA